VAHHQHLALIARELLERCPERLGPVGIRISGGVVHSDLLDRYLALGAQVVERRVAGDAHQPRRESDVARLVLADRGDQSCEETLGDVLGVVMVLDDAAHVSADVVAVAHIEVVHRVPVSLFGTGDRPCLDRRGRDLGPDEAPAQRYGLRRAPLSS
jgi:hypothetical protein